MFLACRMNKNKSCCHQSSPEKKKIIKADMTDQQQDTVDSFIAL